MNEDAANDTDGEFASPPCFMHEVDPVYMGLEAAGTGIPVMIAAVLTGHLAPLGRRGVPSGINKQPVRGRVAVGREGLDGDMQGDRRHHGGPEKALHHYPGEHYARWRDELPTCEGMLATPGAFGENISTFGLTEANVCIGDIFQLGGAIVQVSQGRQPCWRLNERFGVPGMSRRVQETRRTGWYYRVLEEGVVAAGDRLGLHERRAPAWTLARVLHLLYETPLDLESLAELARLPDLADSWRILAERRIERGVVEDWGSRLMTPDIPVT